MSLRGHKRASWATALATLMLVTWSCTSRQPPARTAARAAALEVVGAWTGVEADRFERVLGGFERQSGRGVDYTPAEGGVPALLAGRRAAGDLPDIAFLPQPGLLRQYVAAGLLVPLDARLRSDVTANYSEFWRDLATVDGKLYGVWFKAADKSLIWYNIGAFERLGLVPPHDLPGLVNLEASFRDSGVPPFGLGAGDAWTLTDWFENLYLDVGGPERYDLLAEHQLPWTDTSVKQTLSLLAELLASDNLLGGVGGALDTTFNRSVEETFAIPPRAAMLSEGDFVAGAISGSTTAELGTDVDVFQFPPADQPTPWVEVGGDVAVLMHNTRAGRELMSYLATPRAADIWASLGGFVSPNLNVSPATYPDSVSRSIARDVLDAGDSLKFDLSDLQPAQFGSTNGSGLFAELQSFIIDHDIDHTSARLEAEASAAYNP